MAASLDSAMVAQLALPTVASLVHTRAETTAASTVDEWAGMLVVSLAELRAVM